MPSIHPAALERGAQTAGADSLDPAARPPPVLGVRALPRARGLRGRRTPGLLGVHPGLGGGGARTVEEIQVWGGPAGAPGVPLPSESLASWQ